MKPKLIPVSFSLAVAVALAAFALPGQAQNVNVSTSLSYTTGGGGVYDYTLSLDNLGPEAIESLWLGWVPGSFNIASASSPGNNLGWSSSVDSSSLQYLGNSGDALASGSIGSFTFDSTTTPAQFIAETGQAGHSTAYGINAANGQLAFALSPPDTETFYLTVVPEPSTIAILAVGALGFFGVARRKHLYPR